jgi:transcriptional regulator with XRE-family HTH domain
MPVKGGKFGVSSPPLCRGKGLRTRLNMAGGRGGLIGMVKDSASIFAKVLAQRLALVVGRTGSQAAAAELAGVSLSQFKRYLAGENQPAFEAMVRLAAGARVDLNWLARGEGGMDADTRRAGAGVDERLLCTVIGEVDRALLHPVSAVPPAKKAVIVATAYAMIVEDAAQNFANAERIVQRLVTLAS